ncbi:MAG: aldehyde dehydrogenase family protein, partial [Planctomycetaceae bacterium]|nr:aldehyde dehydrogenase family protein [Planctomycetaceae bacterium]
MTSVSIEERIELCRRCLDLLVRHADTWTHLASTAKGLGPDSPFLAEDILTGPAVVARQLRLTIQTLTSLQQRGSVLLPGSVSRDADGRVTVPVFPTTGHFDTLTFMGLRGTVRMLPHVTPEDVHGSLGDTAATGRFERTCLVLGAGNVSSIPATDALNKILFECRRVILKMNPVNEYLAPVFRDIFAPLIEKELLKIVTGGVAESAALTEDPSVDEIHITGAAETHDAIVWGPTPEERTQRRSAGTPRISKPVTSELGNVTPWIIVPGEYSRSQLDSQAQHVAASITNNASFNCLATKIILTWDRWPQR